MLKLTAVVSLMLIGSTLWAASLSCDSCGSECAAACGTRHFRSCCFNYLRKKRGPENLKLLSQNLHDFKSDGIQKSKIPAFTVDDNPEFWSNLLSNDYNRLYPFDDTLENRLQGIYDA